MCWSLRSALTPPVLLPPIQGKELLAQKLPLWQQACADPNKIPDRAVQLMQQLASSNGAILPSTLSTSKSSLVISDPIPGAKPLPVPPELAPFVGVSAQPPESLWVWEGGPPQPSASLLLPRALHTARPPATLTLAASSHSGCPPRRTHPL